VTVSHTYEEPGAYVVGLTVTNADGSYSTTRSVTAAAITLAADWITEGSGRDKVELTWAGASGSSVDIHRDGQFLKTTRNRGRLTDNPSLVTHVYQVCEEGTNACSNEATAEYPSGGNQTPIADFTHACSDRTCDFFDASTDDGPLTWDWSFGDGSTSTDENPRHSYTADQSYTVTLTVTDEEGATDSASQTVTVPPPAGGITLTASGRKEKGVRYATLWWSGAFGDDVEIRRDGTVLATTENDGEHEDVMGRGGGETFTYRVCQLGGACSNVATVTF
jgi:PKD repeat protein